MLAPRLGGRAGGHALRAAAERASPSFKLWLKYAKPVAGHGRASTPARRGRCARAGRRCCRSGSSSVEGAFDAGDAVEVRAVDGAAIGKGICNYSADELRRVMGRKSAEVREVLPRATEEAVHRDYFVLA